VYPFWLSHEENRACWRPSMEGTAMAELKLHGGHGSSPGDGGKGRGKERVRGRAPWGVLVEGARLMEVPVFGLPVCT
jgi:hypothetical protein